jgi:NAD(P)-dependent dehydrogenase (short-subunit alcohol dehydrogenase family)
LILLTQHALNDPFLVEYIDDLRDATNSQLITAEQVDLSSLHSIRLFATKWVDNAPPRRLDMLILCANTLTPASGKLTTTEDCLESNWGVNYIANFHLLSILSPAIRAQPPDRDVRIIFGMCASYMGGDLPAIMPPESSTQKDSKSKAKSKKTTKSQPPQQPQKLSLTPSQAYATSKLALLTFAHSFQAHLNAYVRPDKAPMNARVLVVDPGWTRSPGMRRYLSLGTLWGLFLYLLLYPLWWLVLKSPEQGAQGFLYAAMEASFASGLTARTVSGEGGGGETVSKGAGENVAFIKECGVREVLRSEVRDEEVQKRLWEESERMIERLEKEGAVRRAREKKEAEEAGKRTDGEKGEAKESSKEKTQGSRRSKKAGGG